MESEQKYYVYVYRFPNGEIFYVGKGQRNRAHDHLDKVTRNLRDCNEHKREIIRSLLAQGLEPIIEIIATFTSEQEAYMYEWALINMTCIAEKLSNKNPQPYTHRGQNPPIGPLETPICMTRDVRRNITRRHIPIIRHRITDLETFYKRCSIPRRVMQQMLAGEIQTYSGWYIVQDCACDEPRCVRCGAQPAGPSGSTQPMCADCHSLFVSR